MAYLLSAKRPFHVIQLMTGADINRPELLHREPDDTFVLLSRQFCEFYEFYLI